MELKQLEQFSPNGNEGSRTKFIGHVHWTDTTLSLFEQQHNEDILVQYHNIFARHRFDNGTNRELKVKLTPNDDRLAYSQNLATPITLKDDIAVELALLHHEASSRTYFSLNMQAPFLPREIQMNVCASWWIGAKSTTSSHKIT